MSFENDLVKFEFNKNTLYASVIAKKSLPENDMEFDDFLQYFSNFYQACNQIDQRFVLFYDLSKLGVLKFEQYNKWTNLFKEYEEITVKCLICSSIISSNSMIANVINTLLKFYDNQKPVKIVTTKEDAIDFINENL